MKSPYDGFDKPKVSQGEIQTSWLSPILLVVILLVLLYNGQQKQHDSPKPDDDKHDYIDDVVPDDDKKQPDEEKVDLKQSYLIRVYETEADKQAAWLVNLLNDDSLWVDWLKSKEMRLYTFDAESNPEQAKSFVEAAKDHGVNEPFLMHCKSGKVLGVIPFEESLTSEKIKSFVTSKGK